MDGLEIAVHGNAQDQLGQILASGKLVIHGDVGQTFLYGAKGGTVFVLGNAAGRPLINAVGKPKVVINGTCLDYLAESFMAGDPHNGGGFVVLNGMEFDEHGSLREQTTPFPGSNLFSLASGGALYVRDPHHRLEKEQLNGGEFAPFMEKDWQLILPLLKENEALFGISVEDLLISQGERRKPEEMYRKIRAVKLSVLAAGQETEEE
jgi:glutamate synthase domain-containing protein 3